MLCLASEIEKPADATLSETSQTKMVGASYTALDEISHPSEQAMVETNKAPDITAIAELRPTSYNKVIEVRVYRKWISVTHGKKNESGFSPKKRKTHSVVS